jgi:hypothetical protein
VPGSLFGGVDFSQVKHVPLHHLAAAINALVFDQTPVVMLLAFFEPRALFEKLIGFG